MTFQEWIVKRLLNWMVKSAEYDREGYEAYVPCSHRSQEETGISCCLGRPKCGSNMRSVLVRRFDEISKRGRKIRSEILGSEGTRILKAFLGPLGCVFDFSSRHQSWPASTGTLSYPVGSERWFPCEIPT